MRDQILSGYLNDFTGEHNLQALPEDELFEHFCDFCTISRYHPDPFDLHEVRIGGGGDLGIDGLAIIVNDHIVPAVESIDHLKNVLRRLDVQFIFVQAKRSSKLDSARLGSFFYGVKQFFSRREPKVAHSQLRHLWTLKEYIHDSSIDMERSPQCNLFYAYGGEWKNDPQVSDRADQETEALRLIDIFSAVDIEFLDAKELRRIYRSLRHKIVREIHFEKHTTLPKIDGVREAYIGILPCHEYMKLLCDDDGTLMKHLFYDNVRDFQGNNEVNSEIADTLHHAAERDKFVVLNNGITVVAKAMNRVGESFTLREYQIVNGCQTSHVLYQNSQTLNNEIYVPIKLIITEDLDIVNRITTATNRQTEVQVEAFASLTAFQKELEEFYMTFGKQQSVRLYYERRSKQYEGEEISRHQIVTLSNQIAYFSAMFLNEPQSTHRYYGELLEAYKTRIFRETHSLFPYYTSARTAAEFERLWLSGDVDRQMKRLKPQVMMLVRVLAVDRPLPGLDTKEIEGYCREILGKLGNQRARVELFDQACEIAADTALEMGLEYLEASRLRAFTVNLIDRAGIGGTQEIEPRRYEGRIKWFSYVRGYEFIANSELGDLFLHEKDIDEDSHPLRKGGDLVDLTSGEDDEKASDNGSEKT